MNMKRKLVTVLIIVLAIVGWFVISRFSSPDIAFDPSQDDAPDLLIEGARLYSYGEDGNRLYDLNADTLRRYSARNELVVENANLLTRSQNDETWRLSANEGVLTDNIKRSEDRDESEKITLRGDIALELVSGSNRNFNLTADVLEYYPFAKRVEGRGTVTITTDSSTLRAESFELDLETEYLRLGMSGRQRVDLIVDSGTGT